ncbi:serine acetyltransferase [Pseudomonas sp. RIT-PI-S]|uniref:serine acetyltransferase n=1 Tax=Pseudomonas sp. RIT-PI-S TaxID=3035295 RepID=UPI0021D8AD18|nr:serine acetyltransferase [Pseudomonas sp. RIT-PI-S]
MDFKDLIGYWKTEITGRPEERFKLVRCWRRVRRKEIDHFMFWFRLAQYLHRKPSGIINYRKMASKIHTGLVSRHNIDILLDAEIGPGMKIYHRVGIVIADRVRIGTNLRIRQNTTIGIVGKKEGLILIGNDVNIGANACIIGDDLNIGDNVTIGAMAFVNHDIASDSICYTKHVSSIRSLMKGK